MARCRALSDRARKAEQAARAAEARDAAWAYTTEQKLHEYLSRRFQTTPIEVTRVDCRATFCEITGQSFETEGGNEFSQALRAVQQESWSDFTGSSFSQSAETGKVIYTGEVRRRQSYVTAFEQRESPEQDACEQLINRQYQRERAARDAQPRDTGWADPMEELLRQYLAAQLNKHPVELDISCRTDFCRIKAKGQATDALLALQKAMMDVGSEPWANLLSRDGGSTGYGDHWTAEYTLERM